jgi:hypothetical protein
MVEAYLGGREASTLRSYESSYRKLRELCQRCDMSIFGLDEGARCLLWSEAKECKLSTGMVKGISAVVAMIREAMGEESSVSGREKVIKRSLFKEDNLTRRKRVRKAATARDVHKLVDEARRSDKRSDWRVAALAVMCYYGCRRQADVRMIRVKDVEFLEGVIKVYMKRHKTDGLNEGSSFSMVEGGRSFNIKACLREYMARLGLKSGDAMFPKALDRGNRMVSATYGLMYRALEDLKQRVGLEASLTWHSFRKGSATKANKLGVRRTVLKGAGKWKSDAVDGYCEEIEPGCIFSLALADCLD